MLIPYTTNVAGVRFQSLLMDWYVTTMETMFTFVIQVQGNL